MTVCLEWESVSSLLEGIAPAPQKIRHLETCGSCQQRLDAMTALPWSTCTEAGSVRPEFVEQLTQAIIQTATATSPRSATNGPAIPGYHLEGELGRGGMGVVYRARHIALQRTVALKVLRFGHQASPRELSRFQTEAKAAARVKHSHIVAIFDIGDSSAGHDAPPYMALEYIDGGTLGRVLGGQPQSPWQAARLIATLARAMHVAHGVGLIHRDLKPANILMQRPAGWDAEAPLTLAAGVPKIGDFGLAFRFDSDAHLTRTGEVVGTPSYMAPEQARGRREALGPPVDIYALGAILYETLTGRPPFKASSATETLLLVVQEEPVAPRRLNPAVPRDLATITMKCLEREPARRYVSAEALAEDLDRFLKGESIKARPVSAAERLVRWAARNRIIAGLVAALGAVLLLGFALVTWKWFEADTQWKRAEDNQGKLAIALANEKQARAAEQQTGYFDKIAAANAEFYANNLREAKALLDDCPKELREWEWHYLHQMCSGAGFLCASTGSGGLPPAALAIRPDGTQVASTSTERFWLHDVHTGKLLRTWPNSDCGRIAWANGEWLVGGVRNDLCIYDPKTGNVTAKLAGHKARIVVVSSSPRGHTLATADLDGVVILWDALERKKLHTLASHAGVISGLAYHPDGQLLASSGADQIRIWDVSTGTLVQELVGHTQPISALAWSPCGKWIVSAARALDNRLGVPGTIKVWNAETGEETRAERFATGHIEKFVFRADGKQLAAKCTNGARRWTWPELHEQSPIRLMEGTAALSYCGAGSRLATLDSKGDIRIWDSETGQEPFNARPQVRTSVMVMVAHPTKALVACGDGAGAVEVFDVATGKLLQGWRHLPTAPVLALAWNAAGTAVAAGRLDNTVLLCPMGQAQCQVFEGHGNRVQGVAFSSDGKQLISASLDKSIKIWNVDTGHCVHTLPDTQRQLMALALDPTSNALAAAERNGPIRLWDLANLQPRRALGNSPLLALECLAFRPDGAQLAAGGPTATTSVHIWDVDTGKEAMRCRGHEQKVTRVCWSPNAQRLASASDDGTIRLWEPRSGRLLLTFRGHKGGTTAVAFSADGHLLISSGWDGAVRVWNGTPVGTFAVRRKGD